jgi:hypothetical protein
MYFDGNFFFNQPFEVAFGLFYCIETAKLINSWLVFQKIHQLWINYWNFSLKTIVSTSRRVGTFYGWDLLGLGTFWGLGCFGVGMFWGWDVLGFGTFWDWDILGLGRFRVGTFWGLGLFKAWDVLRLGRFEAWDILELGCFVLGRSVVGRFVLGRFVGAPSHVFASWPQAVASYCLGITPSWVVSHGLYSYMLSQASIAWASHTRHVTPPPSR